MIVMEVLLTVKFLSYSRGRADLPLTERILNITYSKMKQNHHHQSSNKLSRSRSGCY